MNFRALDFIKQRQTTWHLDKTITWDRSNQAINGLRSTKDVRFNRILLESFKSMNEDGRRYVFNFINEFWHDRADIKSWHKSQCVTLPKSGDLSDPNKC